jgi:hypothetical protein
LASCIVSGPLIRQNILAEGCGRAKLLTSHGQEGEEDCEVGERGRVGGKKEKKRERRRKEGTRDKI